MITGIQNIVMNLSEISTNNIIYYKKVDINYILNLSGDIVKALQDPILVLFLIGLMLILGISIKNYLALRYIRGYIKKRGEK